MCAYYNSGKRWLGFKFGDLVIFAEKLMLTVQYVYSYIYVHCTCVYSTRIMHVHVHVYVYIRTCFVLHVLVATYTYANYCAQRYTLNYVVG